MMKKKELRNLSRKELLEIMLTQTDKIKELEDKVINLEEELNNKNISISNAGTLAEASVGISGIFKKADEAIEIFKDNYMKQAKEEIAKQKDLMLKDADKICKKLEEQSRNSLERAREKSKQIIKDAKLEKKNIIKEAKLEVKEIKAELKNRK